MYTLMMMTSMIMINMNHPLSMGIMLILQTILTSMITGMMMKTFWASYVLIITMLSGMLVLFIYMSSIASNEKFYTMKLNNLTLMLIITMFLIPSDKMIISDNYWGLEMGIYNYDTYTLNKIYLLENGFMTLMLVIYLFYAMIVSTQIVNILEGPMRMKNS
nr:NADH dehydrogenase subunit 6 [Sophianus sp.]